METGFLRTGGPGPRRLSLVILGGIVAFFLFHSSPVPSRADIYRWVDGEGTVHFTDNLNNIPSQYRKGSTLLIREAPADLPPPQPSPPAGGTQAPPSGTSVPVLSAEERAAREREELTSLLEQLRAKIEAKEQHIRAVDAKQSLAVNPLRNRFVDPADLDLYRKYQSELPADREKLMELESRLESIK